MSTTTITALPLHSLPTPPFSPSAAAAAAALHHDKTSQMLDALITHYQRERMWVKQTLDLIALAREQQFYQSHGTAVPDSTSGRTPLWQRRKCRHSLRLSDLSHSKLSKRFIMQDACSTKVLDLFAALLDARIESCKRVESLVLQSSQKRRGRRPLRH